MEFDGRDEFCRLIDALRPALGKVVIAGGWAHRLHRLMPDARQMKYPPLATDDVDVVLEQDHTGRAPDLKAALRDAGFTEDFSGDAQPPVTYYQLGSDSAGFYAEFLTPLRGGTHRRDGTPDETEKIQGVNAQKLRHLELLLIEPWQVEVSQRTGFELAEAASVLIPNPVSFIVQKALVHFDRKPEKRPGDLLYIHDTIEVFSPILDDLAELWRTSVAPSMGSKTHRELADNITATFGVVTDTLRNAARIMPTRRMDPKVMRQVCSEGLKRILR
jgi:hypothetical protein